MSVVAVAVPPPSSAMVRRIEDGLACLALVAMGLLPAMELALRSIFGFGIPGSVGYVQNLALWVGFLGAIIATREGRHLSLASADRAVASDSLRPLVDGLNAFASVFVCTGLFWASLEFVRHDMADTLRIGGWLPLWCVEAILPLSFAMMILRFVLQAGEALARFIAMIAIPACAAAGILLQPFAADLVVPVLVLVLLLTIIGAPIFVAIGGVSLVLFFADGVPIAAIPVETYRLVDSLAIPSIPLFTLAGFLLAEGGANRRLVELFHALFGWLPGGIVVAATLVSAFFAAFTGASGVGILALGGLLLPILLKAGLCERTALGLVTSTGSIGLLFPPSLAVILYAVVAHIPIPDLFVAGIVPGLMLLGAVILIGTLKDRRTSGQIGRRRFDPQAVLRALWNAKWEALLPLILIGGLFGGVSTVVEAAAITVAYLLIVEIAIRREIHPLRDLPRILVRCATMVGGIFAILGIAMGLSSYLVDAQIPMQAAAWVRQLIDSPWMFLLVLNVVLLIVGCLMDIFSAIVIVVPLLLPLAELYGIHPLHLAIVFLVNLELGYLTPPVGLNLFLSAYRFERPVKEIFLSTLPFLLALLLVVVAVTYAPWLIIGV